MPDTSEQDKIIEDKGSIQEKELHKKARANLILKALHKIKTHTEPRVFAASSTLGREGQATLKGLLKRNSMKHLSKSHMDADWFKYYLENEQFDKFNDYKQQLYQFVDASRDSFARHSKSRPILIESREHVLLVEAIQEVREYNTCDYKLRVRKVVEELGQEPHEGGAPRFRLEHIFTKTTTRVAKNNHTYIHTTREAGLSLDLHCCPGLVSYKVVDQKLYLIINKKGRLSHYNQEIEQESDEPSSLQLD